MDIKDCGSFHQYVICPWFLLYNIIKRLSIPADHAIMQGLALCSPNTFVFLFCCLLPATANTHLLIVIEQNSFTHQNKLLLAIL